MATRTGGKGSRKIGRNKKSCEVYRLEGRRERNKATKQERHRNRVQKKREKLRRQALEHDTTVGDVEGGEV